MAIYLLGDLHLSALQPWRLPAGDAFLSWFESLQVEPNSCFIGLGDYTDDAVNPGRVIKQLERFASILQDKFAKSYLLVGNHDLKLYKKVPHLAFEFVGMKSSIQILQEPAEVLDIEGLHILSLPHYNYRPDLPTMNSYYSNLPIEISSQQYDIILGHFADTSSTDVFGHQINLSYLKTNLLCLGDIHVRFSDNYIGSVFPSKTSEQVSPRPRAIWKVTKGSIGVQKEELELPSFLDFRSHEYPNPLPDTSAPTAWTITNVSNSTIAELQYPGAFIKGIVKPKKKVQKAAEGEFSDASFDLGTPLEVFQAWKASQKNPIPRSVSTLLTKLLTTN